jgi:uncharacterized protein YukE
VIEKVSKGMEQPSGSIAGALAIAAMDRAEALDKATVELQATVRKELTELQASMRQEAGEMQAILRKQAAELQTLRQEVKRSVDELKNLQPGIQQSAVLGVKTAVAKGMDDIRRDLAGQVSGSAQEIQNAAVQVRSMTKRLTAQWGALIGVGGLILGIVLSYVFLIATVRDIKAQLIQMQQAAPVSVSPSLAAPPPASPKPGGIHQKPHGSRTAVQEPKPEDPVPVSAPPPDQP